MHLIHSFCVDRLKKKQRAKLKKGGEEAQSADSKQEEPNSAESGGDSDDGYENPFVIGGK